MLQRVISLNTDLNHPLGLHWVRLARRLSVHDDLVLWLKRGDARYVRGHRNDPILAIRVSAPPTENHPGFRIGGEDNDRPFREDGIAYRSAVDARGRATNPSLPRAGSLN